MSPSARLHRRTSPDGARRVAALVTATLALGLGPAAEAMAGPSPVGLGTADEFALLAGSGATNTGVSTIDGDVGSSPTSTQTGFTSCPAADCVALTGSNHDVADPNDAVTEQAKRDLVTAYDDAFGRSGGAAVTAPLGGGQTLVSGVYTSAADLFVGGDLTLDAGGDPDAVFVFQARTGTLTTAAGSANGIPNTRVLLTNGAQACNVFWQVGSSATLGSSTRFVGTIMALTSITANTGATLDGGRVLARNGAVTLDSNTIRKAACATSSGYTGATGDTGSAGGTANAEQPSAPTGSAAAPGPSAAASVPGPTPRALSAPAGRAPASSTPIVRGTSRLVSPTGQSSRRRVVAVTGRRISSVTFWVDGRRLGTVRARTASSGRLTMRLPALRPRRVHRVTARVTYAAGSGTPVVNHRTTFRGPRVAPTTPRFTG